MAVKKEGVLGVNPLPISFKNFAKNPVVGTLFVVLIGISYLYVDIKSTFKGQIENQEYRISNLEHKDSVKTQALMECKTALSATSTKLETLEDMGAIKKSIK
jgi:hypothetical protein